MASANADGDAAEMRRPTDTRISISIGEIRVWPWTSEVTVSRKMGSGTRPEHAMVLDRLPEFS